MRNQNVHEKSLNSLLDEFADSVNRGFDPKSSVVRTKILVEVTTLVRMAKNSQRDYDNDQTEDTIRNNNHWYL
jgi:hypothetical protein